MTVGLWTWLAWTPSAYAATYDVTFCAHYAVHYDDAAAPVNDDFVRSNNARTARGSRMVVRRVNDNAAVFNGYLDDGTSETPGCSTPVTVHDTESYKVILKSEAYVSGNWLRVVDDTDLLFASVLDASFVPTASTAEHFTTVVQPHWNTAAIVGWAMWKNPAGLIGSTLEFVVDVDLGDPSVENEAYLSQAEGRVHLRGGGGGGSPPTRAKYIIAHEMGHLVAFKRTGTLGWQSNYDALWDNCITDATRPHEANSKEFQSAAISEGIAHYYAAIAFNDRGGPDCEFRYYKTVDFNLNGPIDYFDDDPWTSFTPPVSCEDHMERYMETMCVGVLINRGVEWDWLQMFWDLDAKSSMTPADIFGVFAAASPHTWNGIDGLPADDPWVRLDDAADSLGFSVPWTYWAGQNGIAH